MSYIFRGSLCGALCSDCNEQLSDVTVRLYRHRSDTNVAALAVANPNDTFALLKDEQIKDQAKLLIAETQTDANGAFSFTLGDKQKYGGEAFEVDVYCGTVPHRKPGRKDPAARQFTITSVQPAWKQSGEGEFTSIWNHCISSRYWCYIRSLFDAWVICGTLTTCDSGLPIEGATVSATDVDWIQDDPLGSAVTDSTGHFRIDYISEDFKVTPFSPWLNFEWVGGPDVYFKATLGTDVILDEPSSTGRSPGRENIGPCFCVDLCTNAVVGDPSQTPHWQKVWDFDTHPDAGNVGSQFSAEGYAGGSGTSYVFGDANYRGGVLLRGNCPLTNLSDPTHALQYRFVIGEYTWSGTPDDPTTIPGVAPLALVPVTQIASTTVGYVSYQDAFNVFSWADINITSTDLDPVTGWVKPILGSTVTVDMHNATTSVVTVTKNNFLATDELLVLNSTAITSTHGAKFGTLPQTSAGQSLLATQQEPIRRYKLQFEARDATSLVTIFTDTLSSIILNNSAVVYALDLEELFLNLCNPVAGASTVHVLYTIDHPHLNSFSLAISNNSGTIHGAPPMPSGSFLPGPNFFFRGAASGPHNGTNTGGFAQDVSMDMPCAYRVSLSWATREYLTSTGETEILYCK